MLQLPIFPLPLVLLPGAHLSLHIFEPRYRQMVAYCLEADRRFGMVYHDPDESGPFRVEGQVGCIAWIREFQPIPDGRSLIGVDGQERITLEAEADVEGDTMYYVASVATLEDIDPDPADLGTRRTASIDLFQRAIGSAGRSPSEMPAIDETREVPFQLARWIQAPPEWYQQLLASRSELERLAQIDALMEEAIEHLG